MELAVTLKSQTIQNQVREVGINENYWYPVAWADQLKVEQVIPVKIWQKSIAVYRDTQGQVYALENACPHKGIELHLGEAQGNRLVCSYHGWEFTGNGQCVHIPYFPKDQKLPCASVRSYSAQEQYGIVWVFPGEPELAATCQLPQVSEFSDPNCLMIPITGVFQAHFSICNGNTMEEFHGFLHKNLQGWFDPALLKLQEGDGFVKADYRVSYQSFFSRFLGIGTQERSITTPTVSIHHQYPHYHSTLEGVSSLYSMHLPVGHQDPIVLPVVLSQDSSTQVGVAIDQACTVIVPFVRRFLFMPFLAQDVGMMKSEQRTCCTNPQRRYVEVNPAIIALQRVIVRQYEKFMQQSSQSQLRVQPTAQSSAAISMAERLTPVSVEHG